MCDQTVVTYSPNEIVWVKLGNVWWPGQVQDGERIDPDVVKGLRKRPLAIVKFFNENSYEFVGSLNNIYRYNCFKKDDFIRKGLHMLRGLGKRDVPSNITKFPEDVAEAEKLTGGNPNIINDEKYLPEKKISYSELVESFKKNKTPQSSVVETKQSPGLHFKTSEFKYSSLPGEKLNFNCDNCNFSCNLIASLISHRRVHNNCLEPLIDWVKNGEEYSRRRSSSCMTPVIVTKVVYPKTVPAKRKISKEPKKDTPAKKKKVSLPASTSTPNVSALNKRKSLGAPSYERPRKVSKQKTEAIRNRLIKDWDIDSEEEDGPLNDSSCESPSQAGELIAEESSFSHNQSINLSEAGTSAKDLESSKSPSKNTSEAQLTNDVSGRSEKSCFDFEDNDDTINLNEPMKFGQKLPRVISEKRATTEAPPSKQDSEIDLSSDINQILEETAVPVLPDVPGGIPGIKSSPSKLPPKLISQNKTTETVNPDSLDELASETTNTSDTNICDSVQKKIEEEEPVVDSTKLINDKVDCDSDKEVPDTQETVSLPQNDKASSPNVLNEKFDTTPEFDTPSCAEEANKLKDQVHQSDPAPALTGLSDSDEVSRSSDTINLNNGNSEINDDINKFSDISGHGGVDVSEDRSRDVEFPCNRKELQLPGKNSCESAEEAITQLGTAEEGSKANISEATSKTHKRTQEIKYNTTDDFTDTIKISVSAGSELSTREVTSTGSIGESTKTVAMKSPPTKKIEVLKPEECISMVLDSNSSGPDSVSSPVKNETSSLPAKPDLAPDDPPCGNASQIDCSFSGLDVENMELDINSMPIVIGDSSDGFQVLSNDNNLVIDCPTPSVIPPKMVPAQEDTPTKKVKCAKIVYHLKTPGENEKSSWKDKERLIIKLDKKEEEDEEDDDDDDEDDDVQFVSATSSTGKNLDVRMPMPMGGPPVKSPFTKNAGIVRNSQGVKMFLNRRTTTNSSTPTTSAKQIIPSGTYLLVSTDSGQSIVVNQNFATPTLTEGKPTLKVHQLVKKPINSPSPRQVTITPSSPSPTTATNPSKRKQAISLQRPASVVSTPNTPKQSPATTTTPLKKVSSQTTSSKSTPSIALDRKVRATDSRITSNQVNSSFNVGNSKGTMQVTPRRQLVTQSRVVQIFPSKVTKSPNILQKSQRPAIRNPPMTTPVARATDAKALPGNVKSPPPANKKQGVNLPADKTKSQPTLNSQTVTNIKPTSKSKAEGENELKMEFLVRDHAKPPVKATPPKVISSVKLTPPSKVSIPPPSKVTTSAKATPLTKVSISPKVTPPSKLISTVKLTPSSKVAIPTKVIPSSKTTPAKVTLSAKVIPSVKVTTSQAKVFIKKTPQKIVTSAVLTQKKPTQKRPNDILAAALANSALQLETSDNSTSEPFTGPSLTQTPDTSFTINHPIMSPAEVPSLVTSNVTTLPIVGELDGDSNITFLNSNQPIHLAVSNNNVVFSSSATNLPQILTVTSPVATQTSTKLANASLITAQAVQSSDGTLLIVDPSGQVYSTSISTIQTDNSSN